MGSGRGKTRRSQTARPQLGVQTSTPPGERVIQDWKKWVEFVKNDGLGEVNVYEYYLGREPWQATHLQSAKVAAELFADAVALGAVVLPSPYKAEDFIFQMDTLGALHVSLKRNIGEAERLLNIDYFLRSDQRVGDDDVGYAMARILKAITALI